MKKFSKGELAQNNGRDGNPSYVAYNGKVYDVSGSFHWKDGKHQVLHLAGTDLTNAMEHAPHNTDLLEKFPVIGILRVADKEIDHYSWLSARAR